MKMAWRILWICSSLLFVVITVGATMGISFMGIHPESPVSSVLTQIRVFDTALDMFEADCGRYPTTEEGLSVLIDTPSAPEIEKRWQGPYRKIEISSDAWGQPYHYTYPGTHSPKKYDLASAGADGILGTQDDISSWGEPPKWVAPTFDLSIRLKMRLFINGMEELMGSRLLVLCIMLWAVCGVCLVVGGIAAMASRIARKRAARRNEEEEGKEEADIRMDLFTH